MPFKAMVVEKAIHTLQEACKTVIKCVVDSRVFDDCEFYQK